MSSDGFDLGPFHVPQQCRRHKLRSLDMLADAGHHLVDLPPSLVANPNSSRTATTYVLDTHEPSFHRSPSITAQGLSLSLSPGPFTGYAEVLSGSRFLRPAQQLMEEFSDVGRTRGPACLEGIDVDVDRVFDSCSAGMVVDDHGDRGGRKTRLVSMLDEVSRGYRHYYQQMQAVIASFESVHGLRKAAPFTPLVLKSLTKHFRNLKNAITTQLQSYKTRIEDGTNKDYEPHFRISDQNLDRRLAHTASCGYEQTHVWRPQRGLPERAVAVLRAWLFEHFLHPYPTDMDKQILAKQTGLSRNQVSNWFINARVRLWKPMVEEIHSLEMRKEQKAAGCSNQDQSKQCNTSNLPSPHSTELSQSNASRIDQPTCTKNQPAGNELTSLVSNHHAVQPINLSHYSSPSPREETVGAALGYHFLGGNSGVSLTLGLHQTNVTRLSEPYPLSVAQFGLGGLGGSNANISYGEFGAFNSQMRHFDTQLFRDFVG